MTPETEYNPDPELTYLRNFWHYMTDELPLRELRLINDYLASEFDIALPQEYTI